MVRGTERVPSINRLKPDQTRFKILIQYTKCEIECIEFQTGMIKGLGMVVV